MEDRKDVLLRACYDLLVKADESVIDVMETTVYYDGEDCDGVCLKEDIALELGIEE